MSDSLSGRGNNTRESCGKKIVRSEEYVFV